jgi:hypothetical protein
MGDHSNYPTGDENNDTTREGVENQNEDVQRLYRRDSSILPLTPSFLCIFNGICYAELSEGMLDKKQQVMTMHWMRVDVDSNGINA